MRPDFGGEEMQRDRDRFGRCIGALLLLVALAAGQPCLATGEPPADAGPALPASAAPVPGVGDRLRRVPGDIAAAAAEIKSPRVLPWAIAGVAATAAAFALDDDARRWFAGHERLGDASAAGDILGQGYTHAAAAVGLLAAGALTGSSRAADAGVAAAESLVVTSAITLALKAATRRERPGDGASNAFPSGHTSSTAALAASVAASCDWSPGVAVPLGLLTGFVAASRLADDAHWLSDVVGGAALGGVVGASFGNSRRRGRRPPVAVLPAFPAGLLVVAWF